MAYLGSAQASGRATSGAVNPSRPISPARSPQDALDPETVSSREDARARDPQPNSTGKPAPDLAAQAAVRRAAMAANAEEIVKRETTPEERLENIDKLKELVSEALYSGTPTMRERQVAQLAHSLMVRETAALRAQELEKSWKESERREAARYLAAQAAAAYRQLDGYSGYPSGGLIP